MGNHKKNPETGIVYLDKLTLSATWVMLWNKGLKEVIVLDEIGRRQKLWFWMLRKRGICVIEATFFAGHLKTKEGKSVNLSARNLSAKIALVAAKDIIRSEPHLVALNEAYGRNTIRLFITKQLHLHIEYWIVRAMTAHALSASGRVEVWLKKPSKFDGKLIVEAIPEIDIRFYCTAEIGVIELIKSWFLDVARDIKLIHGFGSHNNLSELIRTHKPSVLTLQEDNIRVDHSLRGQPHWVDFGNPSEMFSTFIIKLEGSKFHIADDISQFLKAGVVILPTSVFRIAIKSMRKNKSIVKVRRNRRATIHAIFKVRGFINKYFLLRVAFLLKQAELIGALALWLNTKVFLVRETYYPFADAIQLIAPEINVTTIVYQYSNTGYVSPIMMSTADKYLIFSDMYKAFNQIDDISPQEFLSTGYLYDYVANLVSEKAKKHRETLCEAGAKFIVCYFDESVQHHRWGFTCKDDHINDLYILAKIVLSDPTFGVIVKSQLIRNSPSQLYPKDEMIHAAKTTGRYLELMEGVNRNDIYPTEAALAADLCIGHAIGATASLESALVGTRSILLNSYGIQSANDYLYKQSLILYPSMKEAMEAIKHYRNGESEYADLGDWSNILQYFDAFRDGNSVNRLRNLIENTLASKSSI